MPPFPPPDRLRRSGAVDNFGACGKVQYSENGGAGSNTRSPKGAWHDRDSARARAEEQGFTPVPMRLITELPDGGQVEVTDFAMAPMGDAFARRQLTYTHDGDARRAACSIVFEVRDRVPVCVSLHLGTSEGGSIVRARDLNELRLDDLRDDVYAAAGVFLPNPDGGFVHKIGRFREDRKRVEQVTRRRKVTPEFLSQVAAVYNGAPVGGRLEAIRAAFVVSERQALRYIAQAKQERLIDG
jgi:hypothetical protein